MLYDRIVVINFFFKIAFRRLFYFIAQFSTQSNSFASRDEIIDQTDRYIYANEM